MHGQKDTRTQSWYALFPETPNFDFSMIRAFDGPRVKNWQTVIPQTHPIELDKKFEDMLDDIDSGKIKLERFENFEEYMKHVRKVLDYT